MDILLSCFNVIDFLMNDFSITCITDQTTNIIFYTLKVRLRTRPHIYVHGLIIAKKFCIAFLLPTLLLLTMKNILSFHSNSTKINGGVIFTQHL
jgi:predicted outer membrane repeat protein